MTRAQGAQQNLGSALARAGISARTPAEATAGPGPPSSGLPARIIDTLPPSDAQETGPWGAFPLCFCCSCPGRPQLHWKPKGFMASPVLLLIQIFICPGLITDI